MIDTGNLNADGTTDLLLQSGATLGTRFIQNGVVSGGANRVLAVM